MSGMAGEDRVRDLMDALEQSVTAAKKAREKKLLDDDIRRAGFRGYADCSESDCSTPYLCSEKGSCRHEPMTEEDTTHTFTVEGTTEWSRSSKGPHDCICCEGPHVHGYGLLVSDSVDRRYRVDMDGRESNHFDGMMWLFDAIRQMPEGARVRVTVEQVEG